MFVSVCYEDYNLAEIVTPVNLDRLEQLLIETNYNREETALLVRGFRRGFSIQYEGPRNRQDTSQNMPLRVGSEADMFKNLMDEVRLHRLAGPYAQPLFKNFVQSPISLVPKSNGKKRMIFHLSYDFGRYKS